jgi:hypothetical protein
VSLLVVLVVGTLCAAALGTAATAVVPTAESAQPVLSLAFYPVVLLSGALGGAAGRSGALGEVLRWLPVEPMIDAVTRALHPAAGALPPAHDVATLAGWAVAGLIVSLVSFRWQPT